MKRTRPPSLSRWPRTFSSISRVFCHPRSLPSIPYNKRGLASSRSLSEARCFPSSGWEDVDTSVPVEEETTPNYKPENFYPARIGEVFKNRYQVVGKLGYGSSATVWLCRDLKDHRFVTLKVYIASETVSREIEIYGHLKTIQSGHAGLSCLRPVLEIFQTPSPNQESSHTCLVHPPLGISLDQLTPLLPGGVMTSAMIRTTIRNILAALDFLHTEAHLRPPTKQMLLGIKDNSILANFEQAEFEAPIPRKTLEDRTVYFSRPLPISLGTPVLCDLGEARIGINQQQGDIMPDVYRAPEVILGMTWDYKVHIWNVGMVVWSLSEHRHLFRARDAEQRLNDGIHLAEMQAVLGNPPLDFLARSENSRLFWDEDGR